MLRKHFLKVVHKASVCGTVSVKFYLLVGDKISLYLSKLILERKRTFSIWVATSLLAVSETARAVQKYVAPQLT